MLFPKKFSPIMFLKIIAGGLFVSAVLFFFFRPDGELNCETYQDWRGTLTVNEEKMFDEICIAEYKELSEHYESPKDAVDYCATWECADKALESRERTAPKVKTVVSNPNYDEHTWEHTVTSLIKEGLVENNCNYYKASKEEKRLCRELGYGDN